MSKYEILAELPKLRFDELVEIQAKLDQLTGNVWLDEGGLTDDDKRALEEGLAEYRKNPNGGSSWEEVEARIRGKLRG